MSLPLPVGVVCSNHSGMLSFPMWSFLAIVVSDNAVCIYHQFSTTVVTMGDGTEFMFVFTVYIPTSLGSA